MKNKNTTMTKQLQNPIEKLEANVKLILLYMNIHDHSLSCLDVDTSIKKGAEMN